MRSQRVNNFFAKNFRDISHLITLIVSDLPRARQNVRFRSFPNHRTLLYQRLKIGILRRKVASSGAIPKGLPVALGARSLHDAALFAR